MFLSLRKHIAAICFVLVALISLLSLRAYSVARNHAREIDSLIRHDLKTEALLISLENNAKDLEQARQKYKITGDRSYAVLAANLVTTRDQETTELKQILSASYPELLKAAEAPQHLKGEIAKRRAEKLERARRESIALDTAIALCLAITIALAVWLVYLLRQGLLRPVEHLQAATLQIQEGDLAHRIPAIEAVPELRELAKSFNEMAEKIQALDNSKTEFLATVSHEIKNPLTALKEGLILLAEQGDELNAFDRSKAFGACLISSKRLEYLINNLLHHSKMEAGLYRFDLAPKNLYSVLQAAIDEVRMLADRRKMSIQLQCDPQLEVSFNWDGMLQVFENLLVNAIKYGNEGSTIEIHVGESSESRLTMPHLEISVRNSGQTIPAQEMPRIFDRFYRGPNSGSQKGLGLGLHVVRKIVEAHHGQIDATSRDGLTCVRVRIPERYESEAVS